MHSSQRFWDKAAEKYSKSKISDDASYQKKINETQQILNSDMRVVEFGCGTCSTAITHAPRVSSIDAIDVSENMLEIGREKARVAGVDNINFFHGTLISFDAEKSTVDAVLGLNILHLVADRKATLAEVKRILKDDGYFISSTACIGHSYMRFIKLIAPLAKLLGLMPDVFIFTEDQLLKEFADAGLTIDSHWNHGGSVRTAFIIARKPAS